MPYMTGFADEASAGIHGQILATRELGWGNIESRNIDGVNIHDMSEAAFDAVCEALEDSGVRVNCFGSAIANWGKSVLDPFDITLKEAARAIPRMQRLGTSMIRIMSYAVLKGRGPREQEETERFRRLRELNKRFTDAGIQAVHENCQNYGGMGWEYTLRMLDKVPGLSLAFDTGNPPCSTDYCKPEPRPMQSSWEFYEHVRDHVTYVHLKDCVFVEPAQGAVFPKARFTFPGEGDGDVRKILKDLLACGYDGGISIEPHMAVVHHENDPARSRAQLQFENYVEYGRRTERMIAEIARELGRTVGQAVPPA